MKRYIKACCMVLSLSLLAGCVDDITDLNDNPNNPVDVPAEFIFPSAVVVGTYQLGGPLNRPTSLWTQYFATAGGQFQRIDRYDVASTTFNNQWNQMYGEALNDLEIMIAKTEELPNYQAVALLMKAYFMQYITDLWGDVPYSEAFQGQQGNLDPAYDEQLLIYDNLITDVENALAMIDEDQVSITEQDFVYGGDMSKWRKFGNTLLLKLYMRLSEVDESTARAGVESILNGSAPLIDSQGDDAQLIFGTRGETNENPLSQQEFQRPLDYGAGQTIVELMKEFNDPRIPVYFNLNQNGEYSGVVNGNPDDLPTADDGSTLISQVGEYFIQENSPVFLLTYYERLFLEAEAAIRGWVNAAEAETLYNEAVTAAIAKYGADPGDYLSAGSPASYDANTDKLEQLFLQKYIALYARGPEGFTEWRRSNVPELEPAEEAVVENQLPVRLPYPNSETTANDNFPGTVNIFQDPVEWDQN